VGRTQRMLGGDEAIWRGHFEAVCLHHKMYGIDINYGRHYGVANLQLHHHLCVLRHALAVRGRLLQLCAFRIARC